MISTMAKHKPNNGHKNRSQWNVSLWINNNEGLYNLAKEEIKRGAIYRLNRAEIASNILDMLRQAGIEKTPDGYRYTVTSIRAAIVGM